MSGYITRNYTKGRGGERVRLIVLHTYNGKGRSLYSWFQNNTAGLSAHYAVFLDGDAERYVKHKDMAHHAGSYWANSVSIGIEHQDNGEPNAPRTDAMYEKSAQLVFELCRAYKLPINRNTIRKHSEMSVTGCPGGLDVDRIVNRAKQLMDELRREINRAEKAEKALEAEKVSHSATKMQLENEEDYSEKLEGEVEKLKKRVEKLDNGVNLLQKLHGIIKKIRKQPTE
jgi:N-acetyl-anhydromuramyl-L-alanine amidase AmpD